MASFSAEAGALAGHSAVDALLATVERAWGVVGEARRLAGERDVNVLITTEGGERYVAKLVAEDEEPASLDLQDLVLHTLAEAVDGYRFPKPRPSRVGEHRVSIDLDGRSRAVRLLSHVPGVPLGRVRPVRREQWIEAGTLLAKVDVALADADLPAIAGPDSWNLVRGRPLVEASLEVIAEDTRITLLRGVIADYDRIVAPLADDLRQSLIHGDGHELNILVEPPHVDLFAPRRVTGLIDFGDLMTSWVCAEPAIACTYAMLGKTDPLAAARSVVGGYHAVSRLDEAELAALPTLIRLRLAMSVANSGRRRAEGSMDAYHFVSEAPAWNLLARLDTLSPRLVEAHLRDACGLPPIATSMAVSGWLHEHADEVGPVLEPDPLSVDRLTLDLSVGSTDLAALEGRTDAEAWTEVVFGLMRKAGATLGVGGYDEARVWYSNEAFAGEGEDRPIRRTVHLGADLHMPAGTPVRAPLDGVVVSAADTGMDLDYGPCVILEHRPTPNVRFWTLYGHLARSTLNEHSAGDAVRRGDSIGTLGDEHENGGWSPHLHVQLITDLLDYEDEFPGVARPDESAVWRSLSPDPSPLLRMPEGVRAPARPTTAELVEERRRVLGSNLSLSYREPLHIVRGHGAYLLDSEGQAYLDVVNNVAHVGHSHPRVVEAMRGQASALNTNSRYLHEARLGYVRRLTELFPDPLRVCFLVNSGSEATELALRLARAHTGRRGAVVLGGAYHGNTSAALDLSPYKFDGPGGAGRAAHVQVCPAPDPYRGRHRGEDSAEAYLSELEGAFARSEGEVPAGAFFAESILSCGGQVVPPDRFLEGAFRLARARGAVAVADEVQVGLGRVGTHWWGFETQGALPDIVTMGKPLGNGHPLGAVVTTRAIADSFANGMEYFNTFGGNPVSCAVGLAVLDVIEEEGLRGRAASVGSRLLEDLSELASRHPVIGDVRGRGLFVGIELVSDQDERTPTPDHARYLVERARDCGILLSTDGPDHNVVKMKPPLAFGEAERGRLIEVLERVLGEDAFLGIRARGAATGDA